MKIPKIVYKNNHTYTFIKQCNDNVFLYQSDLGFKEAFNKYDLGMIDNRKIDRKIGARTWNNAVYIVYDRLLEKEQEYTNTKKIAADLEVGQATISEKIRNHKWLRNRWFIERRYKDEES